MAMINKIATTLSLIKRKTLLVTIRIAIADWVAKRIAPIFSNRSQRLFLTHNAGFFSCASVALNSVVKKPPSSISARFGMRLYKKHLFDDPWSDYFNKPIFGENNKNSPSGVVIMNNAVDEWWRYRYSDLPLEEIQSFLNTYFTPSKKVLNKMQMLIDEHNINLSTSIGIHYRGTDKAEELNLVDVDEYFVRIGEILADKPIHKIILQTDDYFVFQQFLNKYGEKLIAIDRPISSPLGVGLHYLGKRNPIEDTIKFFSISLILSKCDYLITHTGNGALWENLYRGNGNNVTQF